MNNEQITTSSLQTKKLGQAFAQELKGGEVICLTGDLGAGKTTFTQGLLKGLGIKGPYTSPTFAILKEYRIKNNESRIKKKPKNNANLIHNSCFIIQSVYHIDAYRVNAKDLIELGFNDFAGKKNTITIIEWPEKVKKIIPENAIQISFQWTSEKERKITFRCIK